MAERKQQLKMSSPHHPPVGGATGQAKGISRATEFLKETLGKEGDIVKANKTDKGWDVEVEVIEPSEYMKKIGIPKPVYDKNVYRVILDQNFDLVSYERKGQKPFGGADNKTAE